MTASVPALSIPGIEMQNRIIYTKTTSRSLCINYISVSAGTAHMGLGDVYIIILGLPKYSANIKSFASILHQLLRINEITVNNNRL